METLKQKLEAVWNDKCVASPCHVNIWAEVKTGYTLYWYDYGLCWKHGKSLGPRKAKVKGKGFSFLPKHYGIAIRVRQEKKQAELDCTCSKPHHLPIWWCKTHGEVTVPMD